MPTPETYIVKTRGSCEELSENHAQGLVIALRMGDTIEQGLNGIQTSLDRQQKQIEGVENSLKSIKSHIKGITDWQVEHQKRIEIEKEFRKQLHEAEEAAEAERTRFWASGWGTAAKAAISVSVVAGVGFLSSIFGGGFAEWIKNALAK